MTAKLFHTRIMKRLPNCRSGAILIAISMLATASCGDRQLCCGYSVIADWTSDVSIARDGLVVFQNVSALVEVDDAFVVEVRDPIQDAPRLAYGECRYARIDKETGARSGIGNTELRPTLYSMLRNEQAELIIQTQYSWLSLQR